MNVREVIYEISGKDRLTPTLEKIGVRGEATNKILTSLNRDTFSLKNNIRMAASEMPRVDHVTQPRDCRRNSYRRHGSIVETSHGSSGTLQPRIPQPCKLESEQDPLRAATVARASRIDGLRRRLRPLENELGILRRAVRHGIVGRCGCTYGAEGYGVRATAGRRS